MSISVIKADGKVEGFSVEKLAESLVRSGLQRETALEVAKEVEAGLPSLVHTRRIFKLVKKILRSINHASTMRYSLKRAISELGPSGYPFERFLSKVLRAYGYQTELNLQMEGWCVSHEVDILARKDGDSFAIECKYHNDGGKPVDVKIALYVHSRAEDLKKAYRKGRLSEPIKEGWLATNTRLTSDAIKYSECSGLKVISWRYPEGKGLERLIEQKRLYPITVLSPQKRSILKELLKKDIVLASEIASMGEEEFLSKSGLDEPTSRALKQQAERLCL